MLVLLSFSCALEDQAVVATEELLGASLPSYVAGTVSEIVQAETASGTPIWVALDAAGAPMFVALDPEGPEGYWTPTVDYVFEVADGFCSY